MLCKLQSSSMWCCASYGLLVCDAEQVTVFWHVMFCKLWSSDMWCCVNYGILVCDVQVLVFWHVMLCKLWSSGMWYCVDMVFWHIMCKLWSSGMRSCGGYGTLVCNAVQLMVFWYVLLWFSGMQHCVVWWMSASILEEPVSLNVLH